MDYSKTYIKNYIKDLNDMIRETYSDSLHPARAKEIRIIISECMNRFANDFCLYNMKNDVDEDEDYNDLLDEMRWEGLDSARREDESVHESKV